ncbi:hypothetical protein M9Y10_044329 [Tritrichomonas musculus]|uniref:IFT122 second beta-propeller domain-containing protein n=1 Tax=Tritrichomonas musculus TaxID=1915356 RepID=A0ABR2K557_9EUKA
MISQLVWKKKLSKSDPIYSFCINPDNNEIIAACSNDVLFLNLESGEILDRKRYHRSSIYSIRLSFDRTYFASSSRDGMVVVWQTKDHVSIINFGSSSAIRFLLWSPTEEAIISISNKDYHIWHSTQARTQCIQIKDHTLSIENGAFSTDGLKYALCFSDCTIKIYQFANQKEIQSFSFPSPLTIIKFIKIDNDECFITVDIDKYVSIFRISDKTLIRKNELSFEALQVVDFQIEDSKYFLFSGISNKISIFTENLMFLDNIHCKEKWIWDFQNCKNENILLCGRNGCIEKRTFCFPSSAASNSDFIIYIGNLNRFKLTNLLNGETFISLNFPNIILSISISYHHFLIMFKNSIYVYLYDFQEKVENNDDLYKKMFEVPGNFDGAKSDISDRNIFIAYRKSLTVYSMSGNVKKKVNFNSAIFSVIKTEAVNDGCIVGCENGSIFFYVVDQPEPVCLYKHKKAIKYAKKWNLTLAFIDIDKELFVMNYFTREVLFYERNIDSFAFSDRVDNLFAYADCNSNLFVRFLHHMSRPFYIEGKIISFFGNDVILLNGSSIVHCIPDLPFEKVLRESRSDEGISLIDFYELVNINPTFQQWESIHNIASEINIPDVALLAAQNLKKNYFEIEYSQKVLCGQIKIENIKAPLELEELGIIDLAIREYANSNDWGNVFRLVNSFGFESLLLDLSIPENECETAAKYLLKCKLYDGAIKLLKKSKKISLLAQVYVSLGRWIDAVTLSLSNPSIHHIVFLRFGEQLFVHKNYFESIVSFFIPTLLFDSEDRAAIFSKLYNNALESKDSYLQMSFVCLLQAFNDPFNYWILHQKSVALYASNRLSKFLMLPMTFDDVKTVFYLSYYVIAYLHRIQIRGIHYIDILVQFLYSSTILGLKKWIDFSLEEISSFSIPGSAHEIVEMATQKMAEKKVIYESSEKVDFFCQKCKKSIFESSTVPVLHCSSCNSPIAFSCHSCRPLPIVEMSQPPNCIEKDQLLKSEVINELKENLDSLNFHIVAQKLKEKVDVKPIFWFNEKIEEIHCCCNCGALYDESDYEEAVVGRGRCAICYSTIVDEEDVFKPNEEDESILNLLRPFEEDSPVRF